MEDELKKLIKQNIKLAKENKALIEQDHVMIKRIKRFVVISETVSVLKIIIIAIPIVLGILYIPPLFRDLIDKYQEFFNMISNSGALNIFKNIFSGLENTGANIDTNAIPPDLLKLLK